VDGCVGGQACAACVRAPWPAARRVGGQERAGGRLSLAVPSEVQRSSTRRRGGQVRGRALARGAEGGGAPRGGSRFKPGCTVKYRAAARGAGDGRVRGGPGVCRVRACTRWPAVQRVGGHPGGAVGLRCDGRRGAEEEQHAGQGVEKCTGQLSCNAMQAKSGAVVPSCDARGRGQGRARLWEQCAPASPHRPSQAYACPPTHLWRLLAAVHHHHP